MVHNAPDAVAAIESEIRCVECGIAADGAATGWKAYIGGGFEGEPLQVVIFCPVCAAREATDG